MRKLIIASTTIALMATTMISCTSKPKEKETIKNLEAAITGESNASAKYAAFATKAREEGNLAAATLFEAAAEAEKIHVNNHQAVLAELNVTDYTPTIEQVHVGTTVENLNAAINGETYENETMYPEFIATAEKEDIAAAVTSFKLAKDAEAIHAVLYKEVLNGSTVAAYYLCPVCGFIAKENTQDCPICKVKGDKFILFGTNETK